MKLPKLAIENYQFTIIVIVLLVLSGLVSFVTMPRSEDPQIEQPGVNIFAIFPGANPEDIEELLIDPIEEKVNELNDIHKINAFAEDGLMHMHVEFDHGQDPDDVYNDVLQKVNSIRNDLPDGLLRLQIEKWETSRVNILQVAIMSDSAGYPTLEKTADRLKSRIERLDGVKKVQTWAFPEQEIRVSVNMKKMAQLRIPLQQVITSIQSAGMNIPGGNLDIGNRRFSVQTSGSFKSIDDIRNTIVHAANGKIVHLRDIADVDRAHEDPNYFARFNRRRAVFVSLSQKVGTNIYDVMDGVKQEIAFFQSELPGDIQLATVFDQSHSVKTRVNGFFGNLLQGVLLVGVIVLLGMSFRAALIVMMVIPISILIALGFVDLSGYGLEQMSIAGLVIALGLLVDNAIVVSENVSRFLKQGYSRKDAAVKGTTQIGWAVVSSTVTTVLAFLPIVLMNNISGDFIRSMPVTVVYTLFASLFVSLTLTPYLASRYLKTNGGAKSGRVQQVMDRFIQNSYRRRLDQSLNRPKRVLAIAIAIFVASLALFPIVGVSFFPKADKTQFIINVETPKGTSLYKTDAVTQYIESILANDTRVAKFAANVGHGNPMIYYNILPKQEQSTHAQFYVESHVADLQDFYHLVDDLRGKFAEIPGARIEVKEFEQGPPVEAPIAIKILGDDLDVLSTIARDVEAMIAGTKGTVNVNNPLSTHKTDLFVNINRAKAGMLGIPIAEIDRTVRAGIAGLPVSTFRDNSGDEYDVVVRLPLGNKPRMSNFNDIYLASFSGAQVPLAQVAQVEFKSSPLEVSHFNLERSVTLTADITRDASVNKATQKIIQQLDSYNWPDGYRYYVAGELESQQKSFGGMLQAILIAMIAIFGVLVLQFRSFSQPLIVFAAIPLAIIGSIIALMLTGYTFSFTAFVGLTSLVGIVVNNSIILVDYTNQLREEGKDLLTALMEACQTRFTPIVLTTATTIGGLLPLTLGGGSMWAPMGWTIIGGLLMSTLLTLVVVPVLYKLFTPGNGAVPVAKA